MKNKDRNKKAEDILSEDALIERLDNQDVSSDGFPEEEVRLAHQIVDAVKKDANRLTSEEINSLDKRIAESINREKRKKTFLLSGAVAGLLILVGLSFFYLQFRQPEISRFASTISIQPGNKFTQLILNDKKEVRITAKESKIKYSGNGTEVKIDTLKEVSQPVKTSGTLFNTLIVPYGKRSRVTLSDSTTIWLNSGTKLIYPAKFDKEKREVYLEGEGFFQVHHDASHPFYVRTRDLNVKVLGTIFDVSAYNDDRTVNTVLESGLVELSLNNRSLFGSTSEKMIPGMLAVYNPQKHTLVQKKVNTRNFTSWKDGYMILEKNTLNHITKMLSRYYNIPIELDDQELGKETFSGYLDLRNSAIQVLDVISQMVKIEIIKGDSQIKIKRKKKPV